MAEGLALPPRRPMGKPRTTRPNAGGGRREAGGRGPDPADAPAGNQGERLEIPALRDDRPGTDGVQRSLLWAPGANSWARPPGTCGPIRAAGPQDVPPYSRQGDRQGANPPHLLEKAHGALSTGSPGGTCAKHRGASHRPSGCAGPGPFRF